MGPDLWKSQKDALSSRREGKGVGFRGVGDSSGESWGSPPTKLYWKAVPLVSGGLGVVRLVDFIESFLLRHLFISLTVMT